MWWWIADPTCASRQDWLLRGAVLGAHGWLTAGLAQAGRQVEKPLAAFGAPGTQLGHRQQRATGARVQSHCPAPGLPALAGHHERAPEENDPDFQTRIEFLQTAWCETRRAGLDTTMVMGLIQVESAFRKFAISSVGARGYMQIMPFWSRVIGDGDPARLFHMQTNIRFGCVILRHYLDRERGDTYMALGRYNGSRGKPQYPNAVYAAAKNWVHIV